ncbi:glycoside hydrolase family 75 protein [Burkholderia seminalis]|uniref:glycoside hydrolase family 75 protein n=1 Tax=Burkholderia seminalis TaxID=488731 RepID=UPI003F516FD9
MLKPTQMRPCPAALKKTGDKYCLPVDASNIPYIAVPGFGPRGIDGKAFGKKTNIALGDLGVVIANGKVVPVIVADYGPAYKIGEGSTALLRKLSVSGTPETINAGVKYIVFPGTSMGRNTSADTLADDIRQKAMALYERLGK